MSYIVENYNTGVILVNWNGFEDTIDCLESLLECEGEFCVVVVDNCSKDESVQSLEKWSNKNGIKYSTITDSYQCENDCWLTIIRAKENNGFAAGCNIAIKYLMHNKNIKLMWLLNNDTIVYKDSLMWLKKKIESSSKYGICGSSILYYHFPDKVQTLGGFKYNKWLGVGQQIMNKSNFNIDDIDEQFIEQELYGINGASMLIERQVIEEIGLLNEDYFLYYEEQDISARIKNKYKVGYAKKSVILHKEGQSIGGSSFSGDASSKKSDYYLIRSRIMFTKKFFPLCMPTVLLGLCVTIVNRLRRRQFDRIPMIIKIALNSIIRDDYVMRR